MKFVFKEFTFYILYFYLFFMHNRNVNQYNLFGFCELDFI